MKNDKTPRIGWVAILGIVLSALLVIGLAKIHFSGDSRNNEAPVINPSPSEQPANPPLPDQSAQEFPPLHFTSSGRLPITLRGFRLGMTMPEATGVCPTLKAVGSDSAPALNSKGKAWVSCDGSLDISLIFVTGRLIEMEAALSNITPGDDEVMISKTFEQLGPSDKMVEDNPYVRIIHEFSGEKRKDALKE